MFTGHKTKKNLMHIHQIFKKAMDDYNVQGKELAAIAGIGQNHLSQFRSGANWVRPEVLEALLEGMEQLAPGSRVYFCQLLAEKPKLFTEIDLIRMVQLATPQQKAEILTAIAASMREDSKNTDLIRQPVAV